MNKEIVDATTKLIEAFIDHDSQPRSSSFKECEGLCDLLACRLDARVEQLTA